jgi:hypothetical protein
MWFVAKSSKTARPKSPYVVLHRDNWDDYGYKTMDGRLADASQYDPQYLLPFAAGHSHPRMCALVGFLFGHDKPPWLCSVAEP